MRFLRTSFFASCLAVGLALTPVAAHAGTAESLRGVYTVSGVNYWNQAVIRVSVGYANGETKTGPDSHCVGSGSVAHRARVFNTAATGGAAALVAEGIVYYSNTTLCPGQYSGSTVGYGFSGTKYFYSQGDTWAWNSGGYYNLYGTFQTQTQQP